MSVGCGGHFESAADVPAAQKLCLDPTGSDETLRPDSQSVVLRLKASPAQMFVAGDAFGCCVRLLESRVSVKRISECGAGLRR